MVKPENADKLRRKEVPAAIITNKETIMKKNLLLFILIYTSLIAGLVHGCKKDSDNSFTGPKPFTEEFQDVSILEQAGWVIKDNSADYTRWIQGSDGKVVYLYFPAYSYTTSEGEFIIAHRSYTDTNYAISSWLITPVLSLKNGDRISFYSRRDTGTLIQDRLQVRMNGSRSEDVGNDPNSIGDFSTVLLDINSAQAPDAYPVVWTRYQHTFSGISGKIDRRIAFRYFVPATANSKGIGIDLVKLDQ